MTSAAVFIDIAKASNCMNHAILLNKLKVLGFPLPFLHPVDSYLADQKQVVKSNGFYSHEAFITDGIPQCSNLGATLFLFYVIDLMNVKFRGFLNLVTDNSCIAVSNVNPLKVCEDSNHDLSLFSKWCVSNRLTINVKKTKVVVFKNSRRSTVELGEVFLDGQFVETVPEYTYLYRIRT